MATKEDAASREDSATPTLTPRPTYVLNDINRQSYWGVKQRHNMELDDYFVGPRDPDKHSKLPIWSRMHGSVLPRMILPLFFVACWSTAITVISKYVYPLGVNSVLLTVLGFVVSLALSLRSSTAYERFTDGRKAWMQLQLVTRNLSRTIWHHIKERDGEEGKQDVLAKVTAMNLILAFAVAMKHRLRFEPNADYDDLQGLIAHLDSFAKQADQLPPANQKRQVSSFKHVGEYLGVSFAESNPRKIIKRSKQALGHLPLEILSYLSAYLETCMEQGSLQAPLQGTLVGYIASMNECLSNAERVVNTPLPLAYSISFSQITWLYVCVLPFQLYPSLDWITIPGCIVAAYIILGLATIGRELENPFGNDVNDLPLDSYCQQIASELDIITAIAPSKPHTFISKPDNLVLFPLSNSGYDTWHERPMEDIRDALKTKVTLGTAAMIGTVPDRQLGKDKGLPNAPRMSSVGQTTSLDKTFSNGLEKRPTVSRSKNQPHATNTQVQDHAVTAQQSADYGAGAV